MSDQSKHTRNYSAADFERYYNGEMSPQEMHELEKAALEDSFLAEALEGYNYTTTPEVDVAELKARLSDTQRRGHIIPLHTQKNNSRLFRVAAMLLLLLGAGWLVYEFAINKPETNISLNDQPARQEKPAPEKSIEEQAPIEQNVSKSDATTENKDKSKPVTKVKKSSTPGIHQNNEPVVFNGTQNPTQDSLLSEKNEQVVAMAQDQVAASTPRPEGRQESIVSMKRAMPMSAGIGISANPKVEVTRNGNQVIITLKEFQDSVNEYVLKQNKRDSLAKKGPRIIIEEAEPEESWSSFGEYISDNLPEDLQTETIKGTVRLSFDVNPSGKPVNIHVEKSLCQKCDEETLRLLEEGPKWKRKSKRGKVSFSF